MVPTHSRKLREVVFPWKIREISGNLPSFSGNCRNQQNLREFWVNFGYGRFKSCFWECYVVKSPRVTVSAVSAAAVSAAAVLPTLFNFPGKYLKLISSNHTWLTYGCGKKKWHPSRWPWVKVTKLPKRDAIDLVPTIKWEPLVQSLQNLVYPPHHGTKGTGVDRVPWCETLRKWVNWMLRWLGYLWPWIFEVKLYLGNGRPDCHGTKRTGVDRMPWCETLRKWVNWTLRWLEYLWPWPLTLNFQGQIVSREWERKGPELIACPDVKHNHCVTSRQRMLLWTGVT